MRACFVAFLVFVFASAPAHAQRRDSVPASAIVAAPGAPLLPAWPRYEVSWRPARSPAANFVPTALTESQEKTLSTLGLILLGAMTLWLLTR